MALKDIDGLPVVDAKAPLKITITAQDISNADRKDPAHCVAALACKREHHVQEVRVHLSRVYTRTNKGNWQRYIVPRELRDEIIAYDRGGRFQPAEFVLAAPQPSKRSGAKRKRGPGLTKGKKRKTPHVVTNVRSGPA